MGLSTGNYTQVIDLGNVSTAKVPLPTSGTTYFFVVTAYNSDGTSGSPSNEVSAKAP
jgi:hypothetical protein